MSADAKWTLAACRERDASLPGRGYVVIGDPDTVLDDRRQLLGLVDRLARGLHVWRHAEYCALSDDHDEGDACDCGLDALLREIAGGGAR